MTDEFDTSTTIFANLGNCSILRVKAGQREGAFPGGQATVVPYAAGMRQRARLVLGLILVSLSGLTTLSCSKPKPPELTPRSAQVSAVRAEGVELLLVLDARNPNSFPIVCSSVTAAFELQSGTPLGNGSTAQAFSIPGESTAPISARLDVRWTSISALAPYALSRQPLPYRLRGTARIGGEHLNLDLPFSIDGQLTEEQVLAAGLNGAAGLLKKP
jgi:LEA14-like dessication related protein